MSTTYNYVRRRPKDKLNILTFPTHCRYETQLAKTGHNFYSFEHINKWDREEKLPENYHLIPGGKFYPEKGYDLILSQSRFGQFELASQLNQRLNIPIITLEHTVPTPDQDHNTRMRMGSMVGDVNVFISDWSLQEWAQYGIRRNMNCIEHCVDTEVFKPTGDRHDNFHVLTVANMFKDRDYCLNYRLWESVYSSGKFPMAVWGKDSNKIAPTFREEKVPKLLSKVYNNAHVYLNTTSHSTIPMSLLEAMACGLPVVTTGTCAIPEVVQHGVNGLIANTTREIIECVDLIKKDKSLRNTLSKNARDTIINRFSESRFISEWNEIFSKTYEASI